MSAKKQPPVASESRITWTYWISRDSLNGELAEKCALWNAKPTRKKHDYRVTWVGSDIIDPGHLGEFTPQEIDAWFRVHPETDLELIRAEVHPTQAELDAQKPKTKA